MQLPGCVQVQAAMDGAANSRSNSQMPSRAQSPDRADHDLPAQKQHSAIPAVRADLTQEHLQGDTRRDDVLVSNGRAYTSHVQTGSNLSPAGRSSGSDYGSIERSSTYSSPRLGVAGSQTISADKSSAQAAHAPTAPVIASSRDSPKHHRAFAGSRTPVSSTAAHVPQHRLQQSFSRLNMSGSQVVQPISASSVGSPQASPSSKPQMLNLSTAVPQTHSAAPSSASSSQSCSSVQSSEVHNTASPQHDHTGKQHQDERHLSSNKEQAAMQTQAANVPRTQRNRAFSPAHLALDADSAAIPSLVLREDQQPDVDCLAEQHTSPAGQCRPMLSPPGSVVAGSDRSRSPATTVPANTVSATASTGQADSGTDSDSATAGSLSAKAMHSTAQESHRAASAVSSIEEDSNSSQNSRAADTASNSPSLLTAEVLSPDTSVQHSRSVAPGFGKAAISPQHPLAHTAQSAEPNVDQLSDAHLQPTAAQLSPAQFASNTDSLSQSPQEQLLDDGTGSQPPSTHAHPLSAQHAPAIVEQLHAAMANADRDSEDAASILMSASSSHSSVRQKHGVRIHAPEMAAADTSTEGTASSTTLAVLGSSAKTQVYRFTYEQPQCLCA